MSQGRLSLVKKFRLSPEVAAELAEKAEKMNMTESRVSEVYDFAETYGLTRDEDFIE